MVGLRPRLAHGGNAERIGLKKWQAKGIELSRGVKLRRGSVLAQRLPIEKEEFSL